MFNYIFGILKFTAPEQLFSVAMVEFSSVWSHLITIFFLQYDNKIKIQKNNRLKM